MATYTSRTVTSTRREWIVPAGPYGATLGDIAAAMNAATEDYRHYHLVGDQAPISDDALRFHVTDDEIVISFTIEAGQ